MATIHGNSWRYLRLLREKDSSGAALYLYWALCAHKNDRGRAYPKVSTLIKEIGFSKQSVINGLSVLRELKLISDVERDDRIDEEKKLAHNRKVYQVHSTLEHDGDIVPMLYVGSQDNEKEAHTVYEVDQEQDKSTVYEVEVYEIDQYNLIPYRELSTKKDSTAPEKTSGDGDGSDSPLTDEWFQERLDKKPEANINQLLALKQYLPPPPEDRSEWKDLKKRTKLPFVTTLENVLWITSHGKKDYLLGQVRTWLCLETNADIEQVLKFMRWYMKKNISLPKTVEKQNDRDGMGWKDYWQEWLDSKQPVVINKQPKANPDCKTCGGSGLIKVSDPDPYAAKMTFEYKKCDCTTLQAVS